MATKAKLTKESATKAVKQKTPASDSPKKKSVKVGVATVISKETEPTKELKKVNPIQKVKAESKKTVLNNLQESNAAPIEKPIKKKAPKVAETVDTPPVQTPQLSTSDKKWQEIKSILEKLKEDTLREIKKSVKNGTEAVAVIEPGGDIYDQASSERDRELGLLLGDREREKIHSIDEALLRIEDGEYGICEECDEDIPLGRLKAMPFARHCVKCKSELEKIQAQTKRVEEERAYREIPLGAEEEES